MQICVASAFNLSKYVLFICTFQYITNFTLKAVFDTSYYDDKQTEVHPLDLFTTKIPHKLDANSVLISIDAEGVGSAGEKDESG